VATDRYLVRLMWAMLKQGAVWEEKQPLAKQPITALPGFMIKQAKQSREVPCQDRERDPGRIPRSDVAHRDAAVLNGSDRIPSHGAPP
jgi:hypothetical protein